MMPQPLNRNARRRQRQTSKKHSALPDSVSVLNGAHPDEPTPEGVPLPENSAKPSRPKRGEAKYERMNTQLKEQIGGLGLLLTLSNRTQADGMVLMARTVPLSDKMTACARENEWFYETLNTVLNATVWVQLAGEVLTIGLMIAASHGLSVPGVGGMSVPPGMSPGGDMAYTVPVEVAMTPEEWFNKTHGSDGN